ncbi:MAG: LPS export ABC transporter permease LptG [Deferribacteres bacterium]|nr:LPS export ABC transporter permease LptG [candidate division KSB1 bacterium]MCB9503006.1 LPS export ABC transporter permease LptG [Deferribacteres bacterium]
MIRLLDRYIAQKFIVNILFALTTFIVIFVVIDAVEKLSVFLDRGAPLLVVAQFYIYYIPYIVVLTSPIAMLLAAMFCIGQLSKYSELVAMKASGISLMRIFTPLFVTSLIVSIFFIYFGEVVVPRANSLKEDIKSEYLDKNSLRGPRRVTNLALRDENGNRIFIGNYDIRQKNARKISIMTLKDNTIITRIDAEKMEWQDSTWILQNTIIRTFKSDSETAKHFDRYLPREFHFKPEDFGSVQKKPEEMSYEELQVFIAEVKRNGGDPDRWLADLYLKIAFPFANFIIVLFGAPLAAGRARSTGALGIALSLLFCFLFFGTIKMGQTLSQTGYLHPFLGAWLGNGIFAIAGVILLGRAPR